MPLFRVWHPATQAHDEGAVELEAESEALAAAGWLELHGSKHPDGQCIVEAPGGRCSEWGARLDDDGPEEPEITITTGSPGRRRPKSAK